MKFRDDIDLDRTWVISDTHFGHANINDFANRPPDHESLMLDRIAQNVGPEDTLLHLGDLCYSNNAAFRALVAPHITGGRKLLIAGNHDKARYSFYKKCGFKLARPFGIEVARYLGAWDGGLFVPTEENALGDGPDYESWTVGFSHYPWNEAEEGPMGNHDLRIHGHIHTAGYTRAAYVPFLKNHVNISVEQTNYQPINLRHLLEGVLLGKYPEGGDPMAANDPPAAENVHVIERFNTAVASHGR